MKKIINDPANVVPEMVEGMVRSYPQYLKKIKDTAAVVRADKDSMSGKVALSAEAVQVMSLLTQVLLVKVC